MYGVTPYYFAKTIMEIPEVLVLPFVYDIIVYFGVGFEATAGHFFYFYLISVMLSIASASFGYFISSIFNSGETATMVGPVIVMPILFFSGFMSNA